jgi:hypothetical protein
MGNVWRLVSKTDRKCSFAAVVGVDRRHHTRRRRRLGNSPFRAEQTNGTRRTTFTYKRQVSSSSSTTGPEETGSGLVPRIQEIPNG